MSFSPLLSRFIEQSPIPVMAQALLERVLSSEWLDGYFARTADKQYTRDLLFSSLFDLMTLTVTNVFPTISNAYKASKVDIGVSLTSVYNKLNGLEPGVMEALIEETSLEFNRMVESLNGDQVKPWLPGYPITIVDGNCIEATHRRLKVLRESDGAPLPGKTLVFYSPESELITDIVPCEDGHAQERSLLAQVRKKVKPNHLYVMDRNFCVLSHLVGIAEQGGYFACRVHQRFSYEVLSEPELRGETETGDLPPV